VHGFFRGFNRGFEALAGGYGWLAGRIVRVAMLMLVVYAAVIGFGLNEFRKTPAGFIPQLDAGYLIVVTQLPGGASLARTDAVNQRVVDMAFAGARRRSRCELCGILGCNPSPTLPTRERSSSCSTLRRPGARPEEIRRRPPGRAVQAPGLHPGRPCRRSRPPPVRGIGNAGGFRMMVEDRSGAGPQALQSAVYAVMGRAAQTPGLTQVFSLFEASTPQLYLDIDRTKVELLGVNVADVFAGLQTYLGSTYVNDFNLLGRTFRVLAQADSGYRLDPEDVLKIRVRSASGQTVPLGSFTTVRDVSGSIAFPVTISIRPPSSTARRRRAPRRARRSSS